MPARKRCLSLDELDGTNGGGTGIRSVGVSADFVGERLGHGRSPASSMALMVTPMLGMVVVSSEDRQTMSTSLF